MENDNTDWRLAVEEALNLWNLSLDPSLSPKEALHFLVCTEVNAALDPLVSEAACRLLYAKPPSVPAERLTSAGLPKGLLHA